MNFLRKLKDLNFLVITIANKILFRRVTKKDGNALVKWWNWSTIYKHRLEKDGEFYNVIREL